MEINFHKNPEGIIPAIIQDCNTMKVLMLGYMNKEAFFKTKETKKVTFFSRSRQRLWTKGEKSGFFLHVVDIKIDCDKDTLLIQANPTGPVCHKGTDTCWNEKNSPYYGFITQLENIIEDRKIRARKDSYVSSLFKQGINKITQKFGEEAVEVIIEAKDNNIDLFLNESADLLFHFLILLNKKDMNFHKISELLRIRDQNR